MRFEDLGLSTEVLQAVADAGYIEPTPIQEKAIPIALQGRDLLGCAQTGTGKTAAFTLPMIDILAGGKAKARMPRSLILTPTRELATQVAENFEIYGKYHRLTQALLIGGVSFVDQVSALGRGVDVLTATPGRLLDLFGRGKILLAGVKILVIDEADRMLDMGFIPDVERIVGLLPPLRQTLFFSATMPAPIRRLADKFLQNPKAISVDPPASPAETVSQALTMVPPRDKSKVLHALLKSESVGNALIFCNRKRDVAALDRSLRRYGFQAAALHGDMTQPARTETLEAFKAGNIRFLVATDVAGRGLDVFGLSHVFNFDVPTHAEDYVHRIGRTGRAGHRGRAITIGTADDAKFIGAIEKLIHREIPRIKVSGSIEIDDGDEDAGRTRDRGRRGRKPAKETAAAESTGSAEPAVSTKTLDKSKPDAGRSKAAEKPARKAETVAAKKTANAERSEERSRRGDDKRQRAPVVGLGDHVPAFLLRGAAKSGKK